MTKYHCSVFKEHKKDNWVVFLDPQREGYDKAVNFINSKGMRFDIKDYSELSFWLTNAPNAIVIHNLFGYDLPLWKKLSEIQYDMFRDPGCRGTINDKQVDLFDSLSMSRLLYPDRPLPPGCPGKIPCPVTGKMKTVGPHGLEAWGMRVGNKKPKIDDWRDQPLWVYVDRCIEDVIINERVWDELILESQGRKEPGDIQFFYKENEKPNGFKQINWKNGLRRGMLADFLMVEQEFQGVCFNREAAQRLVVTIDAMMKEIADAIEPNLPLKEMTKSEQPKFPQKPFKEGTGEISATGWNWLENQLGYPVNREALETVSPPKTAFKQNGEISKAGETYCIKHGVTDPDLFGDFIRSQLNKVNTLKPLPDDLMEQAIKDLMNKKMPDIMVPMKLGNQDDIKKYLIRDAGWQPTIWRAKDVTKDSNKKQRSDGEIDEKVREYLEDLGQSEYRDLILRYLGLTYKQFLNKDKMFKFLRRKARQLPTSPQLKDQRGALCPNLEQVDGDLAKGIVKWLSLRNRRSVLDPIDEDKNDTGLLNHPRLDVDGKLPARSSGRTNTFRMKHQICANMPKPKESVLLGREMRGLWTVPEKHYLIGIDGSNLENMVAAWACYDFDNGAYADIITKGDSHTSNALAYTSAAGRTVTRDESKGITYGILYGGQAAKIAMMLGVTLETGQKIIDALWDNNPGLKARKEWLEKFWEATGKRYIPCMDGRKIYTRSKHSLLNAFFQSTGAVLMDLACVLFHWEIVKKGWYDEGVRRVIFYHDELQVQTPEKFVEKFFFDSKEEAEEFKLEGKIMNGKVKQEGDKWVSIYSPIGELAVKSIEKAAKMMGSPIHITGEYLTGDSWATTH